MKDFYKKMSLWIKNLILLALIVYASILYNFIIASNLNILNRNLFIQFLINLLELETFFPIIS
jgi:hypothetical protein